jgi:hypothetical protein
MSIKSKKKGQRKINRATSVLCIAMNNYIQPLINKPTNERTYELLSFFYLLKEI